MRPEFNPNRYQQLLAILAQGGFVGEYLDLCGKYPTYGDIDGPKLDFAKTSALFKAHDPSAKPFKRWRMIEFGRENIGGWVWTGSLVIRKYDSLDPMTSAVTADSAESAGANWFSLALDARMFLSEATRPSHDAIARPRYDGSMRTMERIVADLVAIFDHMKALIRHGWANTDQVDPPRHETAMP